MILDYEMHWVDFVKMEHMIKQLGTVLELFIAMRTHSGSDQVKWIGDDVSIELILLLAINQRRLDILILDLQPDLHGV